MSVFRVITRIIPVDSAEGSFEPAPFSVLTDGISKEVKVLNLTEPQTGMKYRIERIEDIQHLRPGETNESVNKAFAEKLKKIPGFVQLKPNDAQQNVYNKSFKLILPQVVSLNCDDDSSKNSNSLTISVVKNCDYNNVNSVPQLSKSIKKMNKKRKNESNADNKSPKHKSVAKNMKYTVEANKREKNDAKINLVLKKTKPHDAVYENGRSEICNDTKPLRNMFKSKYPTYLSKRLKKSTAFRNKNNTAKKIIQTTKPLKLKLKKSDISYFNQCNGSQTSKSQNFSPAVSDGEANSDTDTAQDLDTKTYEEQQSEVKVNINDSLDNKEIKAADKSVDLDKEKNDSVDDFLYDFGSGDLVINEPEATDSASDCQPEETVHDKCDKLPVNSLLSDLVKCASKVIDCDVKENACTEDSNSNTNQAAFSLEPESSVAVSKEPSASTKFLVPTDHPLYDILQPLKKYFVNCECIICGFLCENQDYNAAQHMETHIFVDSSPSSYKCHCCEEKFSSPRTLYKHALSREKSYKYMCHMCLLKFKRQHYLVRHSAKAHSNVEK